MTSVHPLFRLTNEGILSFLDDNYMIGMTILNVAVRLVYYIAQCWMIQPHGIS